MTVKNYFLALFIGLLTLSMLLIFFKKGGDRILTPVVFVDSTLFNIKTIRVQIYFLTNYFTFIFIEKILRTEHGNKQIN